MGFGRGVLGSIGAFVGLPGRVYTGSPCNQKSLEGFAGFGGGFAAIVLVGWVR